MLNVCRRSNPLGVGLGAGLPFKHRVRVKVRVTTRDEVCDHGSRQI